FKRPVRRKNLSPRLETILRTAQGKLIRLVCPGSGLETYDNVRSQRLNEKKAQRNNRYKIV
ncbi:MAG: hypothetical protein ACLQDI_06200, partial [Syntrophobacteraceae bacterium]